MILAEASNDTLVLAKAATSGVRRTWCCGFYYSKAGVITVDLVPLADSQRALQGVGRLGRDKGAARMDDQIRDVLAALHDAAAELPVVQAT